MPVAQVGGNDGPLACPDVGDGLVDTDVGGVALRGGSHVDGGMGQGDSGLGHTDEAHCLVRRDGDLQGGGVRSADVLGGDDDQTPRYEPGVLPPSSIRAR